MDESSYFAVPSAQASPTEGKPKADSTTNILRRRSSELLLWELVDGLNGSSLVNQGRYHRQGAPAVLPVVEGIPPEAILSSQREVVKSFVTFQATRPTRTDSKEFGKTICDCHARGVEPVCAMALGSQPLVASCSRIELAARDESTGVAAPSKSGGTYYPSPMPAGGSGNVACGDDHEY